MILFFYLSYLSRKCRNGAENNLYPVQIGGGGVGKCLCTLYLALTKLHTKYGNMHNMPVRWWGWEMSLHSVFSSDQTPN